MRFSFGVLDPRPRVACRSRESWRLVIMGVCVRVVRLQGVACYWQTERQTLRQAGGKAVMYGLAWQVSARQAGRL